MGLIINAKYRIERELITWGFGYHLAKFENTGRTEKRLKHLERIQDLEGRANRLIEQYCTVINPLPADSNVIDARAEIYERGLRRMLEKATDGWI